MVRWSVADGACISHERKGTGRRSRRQGRAPAAVRAGRQRRRSWPSWICERGPSRMDQSRTARGLREARSRIMKPVDDSEVWPSHGTCVAKCCRCQGQHRLLAAAVLYAKEQGAGYSRPIRSISPSEATARLCSSGRDLCTSARASPRSYAARRPENSCAASFCPAYRCNESPGLIDVSFVGCQAVRLGVRLVDSERDDPPGMDPDARAARS